MPRHPRHEDAGATHHVVVQGSGRRPFALDDRDRDAFLSCLRAEASRRAWVLHAWCLLDTHHHVLVTTPEPDLGVGVGRALGSYAAAFNRRHGRGGAVFAERFWSRRAEGHLVRAAIYALVNPVAAGRTAHPRAWPWSSYHAIARDGCSATLAQAAGGTAELLALVDAAVERILERRAHDGRGTWAAVAEVVPAALVGTPRVGRG